MKQWRFFVLTLTLFVISSNAQMTDQKKEVPQAVKSAFSIKFPAAKKVQWEKENESEWEAEFKMEGAEYSANFSEDGSWQETEHEIKKNEVPANIVSVLNAKFPGYKIEKAEISETAEGKFYEFELEKGKEEMEVTIDMNGKVIQKELSLEKENKD